MAPPSGDSSTGSNHDREVRARMRCAARPDRELPGIGHSRPDRRDSGPVYSFRDPNGSHGRNRRRSARTGASAMRTINSRLPFGNCVMPMKAPKTKVGWAMPRRSGDSGQIDIRGSRRSGGRRTSPPTSALASRSASSCGGDLQEDGPAMLGRNCRHPRAAKGVGQVELQPPAGTVEHIGQQVEQALRRFVAPQFPGLLSFANTGDDRIAQHPVPRCRSFAQFFGKYRLRMSWNAMETNGVRLYAKKEKKRRAAKRRRSNGLWPVPSHQSPDAAGPGRA
ncbi:unnamed protein product [Acanthosepion pharaonis]|uniref:Uncharacterized protein n=1 Tax=Acanthosepion pharaonis TaxID=158019 RepID=A0A812DMP2_ACAPH|nr:unnamed protein product [Sepia pharaonis]